MIVELKLGQIRNIAHLLDYYFRRAPFFLAFNVDSKIIAFPSPYDDIFKFSLKLKI